MTTRARLQSGDGDERHGTVNGYCNLRCRCELCREAWRGYIRGLRRTRRNRLSAADERHGRYTTYTNHFCRCELCRGAHSQYQREWRVAP